MARRWYYVVDTGTEWEVRGHDTSRLSKGLRYSVQEDAVQAAVQLARTEWRLHKEPTGVRIPSPFGGWLDVKTYGESGDADAAA